MIPTPVVLLSTTATPTLHGVLGMARTLGRRGAPVHLVHPHGWTPMGLSRYVVARHPLALDDTDPAGYVDAVIALGTRLGAHPVLLPTDDTAALVVAEAAPRLRARFRLSTPTWELATDLSHKQTLAQLCLRHGVDSPRSVLAPDADGLAQFVAEVGLPVVVKAVDAAALRRTRASGGASVRVVESLGELRALVLPDGEPDRGLLLQEHLPGDASSVWMVNAYFDSTGRCRRAFTARKLRQFRPRTGYTSYGQCAEEPEVLATAVRFLGELGYTGIVDMGFRRDARDGRLHLLDVNPRVGATFRLFAGEDGEDVVTALYDDLTTGVVTESRPAPGRTWAVEPQDLLSAACEIRAGRTTPGKVVREFLQLDECAWWDRHDPLPFLGLAAAVPVLAGQAWRRRQTHRPATERPALPPASDFGADGYWRQVYEQDSVEGALYRRRLREALGWIHSVGLPAGSRVLEVGAGNGALTLALARQGYSVTAVDSSPSMLASIRQQACEQGLGGRVTTLHREAENLHLPTGCFPMVVALGLLPWVSHPQEVLAELRRVLAEDGRLVVSTDNGLRAHWWLDPLYSPGLAGLRRFGRRHLGRLGHPPADGGSRTATLLRPRQVDAMLAAAGLVPQQDVALGFGPFSFLGRRLLPDPVGVAVSRRLEDVGARRPVVARHSSQHLLLCLPADVPAQPVASGT